MVAAATGATAGGPARAADDDAHPVYTVGHSTRPIEEFVALLRSVGVRRLVDVRTIPRSRTNPQYNLDTLPDTLAGVDVLHTIIPELGGRRGRSREVPREVNGFWTHPGFHNYADHAMSEEFRRGLDRLTALSLEMPCAVMCSEAVWWRCHRRIIADYLLADGRAVLHLMGRGRIEPARMTPGAVARDGVLTYPGAG